MKGATYIIFPSPPPPRTPASADLTSGCVGRVFALDLDDSLNGSVFYWNDTSSPDVLTAGTDGDGDESNLSAGEGTFGVRADSGMICTDQRSVDAGDYRLRVSHRVVDFLCSRY